MLGMHKKEIFFFDSPLDMCDRFESMYNTIALMGLKSKKIFGGIYQIQLQVINQDLLCNALTALARRCSSAGENRDMDNGMGLSPLSGNAAAMSRRALRSGA